MLTVFDWWLELFCLVIRCFDLFNRPNLENELILILGRRRDHRGSLSTIDIIKLDCFYNLLDLLEIVCWVVRQASDSFLYLKCL